MPKDKSARKMRVKKAGRVGAQLLSGMGVRLRDDGLSTAEAKLSFNKAFYSTTNGVTQYVQNNTQLDVKGVGTDPAARQSPITIRARYEMQEHIRAKHPSLTWEANWNGSITDPAKAFIVERHLPIFYEVKPDAPAEVRVGGEPFITGFASMTNLMRDLTYGFLGFAQNPGKPRGDGDQQSIFMTTGTCDTMGVITTVNFGTETIHAGDKIFYTPESNSVLKGEDRHVARFVVKGLSEEFLPPQSLPMATRHVATTLAMLYRASADHFDSVWKDPNLASSTFPQKLNGYRNGLYNEWYRFQPFYYHMLLHTLARLYDRLVLWFCYEQGAVSSSDPVTPALLSMLHTAYTASGQTLVQYYRKLVYGGDNWDDVKAYPWIKATEASAPIPMNEVYKGELDLAGLELNRASVANFSGMTPAWKKLIAMSEYLKKAAASTRNECQNFVEKGYGGEALTDAEPGGDFDILIRATC